MMGALQLEIVTNVRSWVTTRHIVQTAILEMLQGGEEVLLRTEAGEVLNTESSTVRTVKTTVRGVSPIGVKACENWISTRVNNCWRPIKIAKNAQEIVQKERVNRRSRKFADKV